MSECDIFLHALFVDHINEHVNGMENDHIHRLYISALTRCVTGATM